MKPEKTINGSITGLGWAKHKRNADRKKYYRTVRRKVKRELKEETKK